MTKPVRNHLVWVVDSAWQEVVARLPDEQARGIAACWRARDLPLVVSSQPAGLDRARVALGLPAPGRWLRRRLSFDVALEAIRKHGRFPTLGQASSHYGWPGAAVDLDLAVAALGAPAHVYGSHGWQMLTGESYLHEGSDIDLCVDVGDFETACAVVPHLEQAALGRRVDGELIFREGSAVAWREFGRMLVRGSSSVLVKRLDGPRLVRAEVLRRDTARSAEVSAQAVPAS